MTRFLTRFFVKKYETAWNDVRRYAKLSVKKCFNIKHFEKKCNKIVFRMGNYGPKGREFESSNARTQ